MLRACMGCLLLGIRAERARTAGSVRGALRHHSHHARLVVLPLVAESVPWPVVTPALPSKNTLAHTRSVAMRPGPHVCPTCAAAGRRATLRESARRTTSSEEVHTPHTTRAHIAATYALARVNGHRRSRALDDVTVLGLVAVLPHTCRRSSPSGGAAARESGTNPSVTSAAPSAAAAATTTANRGRSRNQRRRRRGAEEPSQLLDDLVLGGRDGTPQLWHAVLRLLAAAHHTAEQLTSTTSPRTRPTTSSMRTLARSSRRASYSSYAIVRAGDSKGKFTIVFKNATDLPAA